MTVYCAKKYVNNNLSYFEKNVLEWEVEKATKPLQYVSHARKLERNVWEYPACFAGVWPTFKTADFTAKRSIVIVKF